MLIGLAATLQVLVRATGSAMARCLQRDAIARQPEATNNIRTNMIVIAALIEGVALSQLSLVYSIVCMC